MEMVDFQWSRCLDGYLLERDEELPDYLLVKAKSDRFEQYRPLEISGLFSIFAEDTPPSPEGMQRFADRFGLLHEPVPISPLLAQLRKNERDHDFVSDMLENHQELREALRRFRDGDYSGLTSRYNSRHRTAVIRTELRVNSPGRPELTFAPPGLIQAIWLQFALFVCSDSRLFRCERCNQPFAVGSGTGRRSTSKFCSNACKVAAFKDRHAQAEEGGK
jgi:hypothetical protein